MSDTVPAWRLHPEIKIVQLLESSNALCMSCDEEQHRKSVQATIYRSASIQLDQKQSKSKYQQGAIWVREQGFEGKALQNLNMKSTSHALKLKDAWMKIGKKLHISACLDNNDGANMHQQLVIHKWRHHRRLQQKYFTKPAWYIYSTDEAAHRLLVSCAKQAVISSYVIGRFAPLRNSRIRSAVYRWML